MTKTGICGLAQRYGGDSILLEHYRRKLLVPGWAGSLDEVEVAFIAYHAKDRGQIRKCLREATLELSNPRRIISGSSLRRPLSLAVVKRAFLARKTASNSYEGMGERIGVAA